jgi:hypothetical protein
MLSFQPPGLFKVVEAHCRLLRRFTADDVEVNGMFLDHVDVKRSSNQCAKSIRLQTLRMDREARLMRSSQCDPLASSNER